MWKSEQDYTQIHECKFCASIESADLNIRFPCTLFVSWKTASNKILAKTKNDNVGIKNNKAIFGEELEISSFLRYDRTSGIYCKKETILGIYLISKRKPNEQKLVGRVTVDLADVTNSSVFQFSESHSLSFCSVAGGSLRFSISVISKQKTEKQEEQIQFDSFSQSQLQFRIASLPSKANWSIWSGQNEDTFLFKKQEQASQNQLYRDSHASEKDVDTRRTNQNNQNSIIGMEKKVINLEIQNNVLKKQNEKLVEVIKKINEDLAKAKERIQIRENKILELKQIAQSTQQQKDDFVAELQMEIQKLKNKFFHISEEYEQSQQIRLELESQVLQIKFELSQLKTQKKNHENKLLNQNELIKKLQQSQQKLVKIKSSENIVEMESKIDQQNVQQNEISNGFSQKKEISLLKNKVNALEKEAEFYENLTSELNELADKYNKIAIQKKSLEEQISIIVREQLQHQSINTTEENKLQRQFHFSGFAEKSDNLQKIKQTLSKKNEIEAENEFLQQQLQLISKNLKKIQEESLSIHHTLYEKDLHTKTIQKYLEQKNQQINQLKQKILELASVNEVETKHIRRNSSEKLTEEQNKQEGECTLSQLNEKIIFIEQINQQLLQKNQSLEREKQKAFQQLNLFKEQMKLKSDQQMIFFEKGKTTIPKELGKFTEKQKKIRQNIITLEEQSMKIYQILMEKQQNEKQYSQLIEQKEKQRENLHNDKNLMKIRNFRNQGQILWLEKQIDELKNQHICLRDFQKSESVAQSQSFNSKVLASTRTQRIGELERTIIEKQVQLKTIKRILNEKIHQNNTEEKFLNALIKKQTNQNIFTIENNENKKSSKEKEAQLIELGKKIHILEQELEYAKHRAEKKEIEGSSSLNSEFIPIFSRLCDLLTESSEKKRVDSLLQLLLNKNTVLEQNMLKISEDRGTIQQTARKLSMQFQRIKSNIVKAKGQFTEKKLYLDSLKPCQGIIKDLISMAQMLSQQPLQF